jgi:vitamin B12 transporter
MFPLIAALVAASTTPTPSPSPSPVPEIAHVVTSDRGSETAARAARTTYVVTAAQIARDGDRTVADAIENIPGVNLVRYGAFGSIASMGIRGSSSQQVLVLVDGLPVAGSQIDDVNLGWFPVSGIDRIEIVEGGGSTLYGSGSIGGVINIITAAQPARSSATLATGSFGEQTYAFTTPYLSFQRTYATNDYAVQNAPNQQNAQAGLTSLAARYGHSVGALDLTLGGDIADARVGAPGQLGFFSPTSEDTNVNRDIRLSVERKGPQSTTSLQLGDSSEDLSFTCHTPSDSNCPNSSFPTPGPGMKTNPPYAELLYDQHWMASVRNVVTNESERLVYGVDLMRGIARVDQGTGGGSPLAADNAPIFDAYAQTAAYLQSQWFGSTGNELYAGLRAERDGGVGGALSPSLGGILRLAGPLSLRLNAATAFRAPTAEDLYYPGFSNPNLQPERTRVADATLVESPAWGSLRFGWFETRGSNLIVSPPPAFIPENAGHALIAGLTLGAQARTFYGCVASLDVTNLYLAEDQSTDARIPGRGPVFTVTLGLSYDAPAGQRFDGFKVAVRTQGQQESPDSFLAPSYAVYQPSTFTNVDGYVGYRVTPALVLGVRGYNLGDARYAFFAGYPMPGRSFSVELRSR